MGSSGSKVSNQDRAVLDLKLQRDKLQQLQKRTLPLVGEYKRVAAQHLAAGDKQRALLSLRRKKYHESLLAKTDNQLAQLEALVGDVEFALVQRDVVFGLKRGNEVLRQIHREMGGVEAVEKLVGDSIEERAYQQEVADILASSMTAEEEDEAAAELAALQAEQVREGLPQLPADKLPPSKLPATPQGELEDAQRAQAARAAAGRQAVAA